MTTFDQRDKDFENKFAHDEEVNFRITVRRNKLLGLWAAAKLGKSGTDAEAYAGDVVEADIREAGHSDTVDKILKDFEAAKLPVSAKEIRFEMERLLLVAREQVMKDKK